MPSVVEWDLGLGIFSTYDADGFLSTQIDAPGEANAKVRPYETHFPYGLYARPSDAPLDGNENPDPTKSHQVLYALEGGLGHSFPLENPDVIQLLPTLDSGETMFYGPKGQFIRNTVDGHIVAWAPTAGSSGENTLSFGDDGFVVSGPWGKLELGPNGFSVTHTGSGASLNMGTVGGLPAPVSSIGSHISMKAGFIDLESSGVSLGPSHDEGGIPAPVPNGVYLMAWMWAVGAAIKAIASALATGGVTASGPATFPTASAVVAAAGTVVDPTPITLFTTAQAMA